MTREELWSLIQHHADAIAGRKDVPTPYFWHSKQRLLAVSNSAERLLELCKQLYPLEVKEEEQMSTKLAECGVQQANPSTLGLSNRIR